VELEEQRKLPDQRESPRREVPRELDQRKLEPRELDPEEQPAEDQPLLPQLKIKIMNKTLDQLTLPHKSQLPDQVPRKDQQRKAVLLKEDLKRNELS
jgi:hypothetical protein